MGCGTLLNSRIGQSDRIPLTRQGVRLRDVRLRDDHDGNGLPSGRLLQRHANTWEFKISEDVFLGADLFRLRFPGASVDGGRYRSHENFYRSWHAASLARNDRLKLFGAQEQSKGMARQLFEVPALIERFGRFVDAVKDDRDEWKRLATFPTVA